MPPAVVMKNLMELMFEYDIQVIFAGTKAKNIAKGLLLKAAENFRKNNAK